MHLDHKRILPFAMALLALAPAQGPAQGPLQSFNPQAVLKEWGQVLFCQEAYHHPDNAPRVYEYDLQQCETAEAALLKRLGYHTPETRTELRKVAQGEATRIRASTRDIGQVLGACREHCARLAAPAAGAGADTPNAALGPASEPGS
jgi:hypothetical protein